MNNPDDQTFHRYCGPQNLSFALTTLRGIIKGMSLDGKVDAREAKELRDWCSDNASFRKQNPFNELLPMIDEALEDGVIELDELKDIRWFLDKVSLDHDFYNGVTEGLQFLQGLLHGILSDGSVSEEEAKQLSEWLEENAYLSSCFPYDEIYSMVMSALKDGKLDKQEAEFLKAFFSEFVTLSLNNQIDIQSGIKKSVSVLGVCVVDPKITFDKSTFCFTGASVRAKRSEFATMVEKVGGVFSLKMRADVDYLIYGAAGNQCWAYSCYGRKVERAIDMRRQGDSILIIHENDFWDGYEDLL
jgi:hypothetical protein